MIGGSGGAADRRQTSWGGTAGGGAILIATTGGLHIDGEIHANGANTIHGYEVGGGSGGGIRLVSDTLSGSGKINTLGGTAWQSGYVGRIRIERAVNNNTLTIAPDPSVVPLGSGATALLWPPSGAPEVKIVSIGGKNAPTDPRAGFGSAGADVSLPETTSTEVLIETTNVEQASQVQVRLTPRSNSDAKVIDASVASVVSSSPLVVRWRAELPVKIGYSAVQVKVVRP